MFCNDLNNSSNASVSYDPESQGKREEGTHERVIPYSFSLAWISDHFGLSSSLRTVLRAAFSRALISSWSLRRRAIRRRRNFRAQRIGGWDSEERMLTAGEKPSSWSYLARKSARDWFVGRSGVRSAVEEKSVSRG